MISKQHSAKAGFSNVPEQIRHRGDPYTYERKDFNPLIKTRPRKIFKLNLKDKRPMLHEDPQALWTRFHLARPYPSLESKYSVKEASERFVAHRSLRNPVRDPLPDLVPDSLLDLLLDTSRSSFTDEFV